MLNLIRKLWYFSLPRTRTVYKVVRQRSKYKSVIAYGEAEVKYKVGKWATAPKWLNKEGYDLTCFRRLEDAKKAIHSFTWHNVAIWKATARTVKDDLPPVCHVSDLSVGYIMPYRRAICLWPQGTIMAKAIRLEEKVWDSKEGE